MPMANPDSERQANSAAGQTITLDQLVSSTATSVLRTLREHDRIEFVNPKIWVGIWIDLDRLQGKFGQGGPGGPQA
jgi:hypothetical protein